MKGAKNAIGLIVFIDEIEKAMPSGGKGSGDPTARTMFGTLLTFMQELGPNGMVLEGGPGTGKSLVATAVGSVLNVPTVQYDITGMKDSLVGASERNQREAHKVIKVFGGRVFWIATCNSAEELPPELLRRFPRGKYFVDTPDDNEVQAIKAVYLRKHPSVADDGYNFSGFTGAEIRTVVETADEFNCSLSEAAKWTIPYSVKEAGALEALRRKADGKMMSVSYDGLYRYEEKKAVTNGTRKMF
jgi:SpoVK/Ycf46/Vps4 family AAA+-type ATPase